MATRPSLVPIALLIALGTSWGLRVTLIKIAAQSGIPHATTALVTTLGVAGLLTSITLATRRTFPLRRSHLLFFVVCAVLGYVVPFFLQLHAAARVPAATLALIFSMLPITTLVLAHLTGSDHVERVGYVAIALGIVAVAVLLGPEVAASGVGAAWGIVVALLVPVTFGVYYSYIGKGWPAGLDSIQVATGEVIVAIPLMLPVYLWQGAVPSIATAWGTGEWAILIMILFWTLDTYLYFEIVGRAGPVFTSQGNYIMLLSGVAWGALLLNERPTERFWLSLIFVVVALVLLTWQRLRDAGKRPPTSESGSP